jgi:hypothetical protein
MDENSFHRWLRKEGRTEEVADRVIRLVAVLADFLSAEYGKTLETASPIDLDAYIKYVEQSDRLPTHDEIHPSPNSYLWAIRYFYQFSQNEEMAQYARLLRGSRIKRQPFKLRDFRGVDPAHISSLENIGIKNINQMLKRGKTLDLRQELAKETGIPLQKIIELVKLSDLARIPGVKSIRARLYHDADVDTVEKMTRWNPAELHAFIAEYVEHADFDGIAPLPGEIHFTINTARSLPSVVDCE